VAETLQDIGAIQSGGAHAYTDAIEGGAWSIGDLTNLKTVNAAE
jgi:hypothetical protein